MCAIIGATANRSGGGGGGFTIGAASDERAATLAPAPPVPAQRGPARKSSAIHLNVVVRIADDRPVDLGGRPRLDSRVAHAGGGHLAVMLVRLAFPLPLVENGNGSNVTEDLDRLGPSDSALVPALSLCARFSFFPITTKITARPHRRFGR